MPTTTITRIESLRDKLGITQKTMARLVGVTERTVIDLENGRKASEAVARRLTELERLFKSLSKVVRARAISNWLSESNQAFAGDSPIDIIAAGKVDLLWQMIFQLRAGVGS